MPPNLLSMMANSVATTTSVKEQVRPRYRIPFILVTTLFFCWGLIHNVDPILIAQLRKTFQLTILQSSLIDSAVFIAYFLMAIPAGVIMRKFGYKNGIITGLLIFSAGAFLFVPAAAFHQYAFFLGALFIIACGLTMLETAANPYATILGPPETAAFRLNLAQSFNGLAASVAPLLGKWLILTDSGKTQKEISALAGEAQEVFIQAQTASIKMPFLILGSALLVLALIFFFTHLPDITESDEPVHYGFFHAFRHAHLKWGVIAQFFYVGAQVCVQSFFIVFVSHAAGLTDLRASDYLAIYGFAFMIGRFVGTFLMKFIKPEMLLALYASINILLSVVAISGSGMITVYALIGIGFFMSIMFPTIFSLGINQLGVDTKAGSSLLIMAIVGGALLPPVLGYVADQTSNIQYGYWVPACCFVVILLFAVKGYKIKSA